MISTSGAGSKRVFAALFAHAGADHSEETESMKRPPFQRRLLCLAAACAGAFSHALPAMAQSAAGTAPAAAAIRTKHATFEPAAFTDLPGWRDDALAGAMAALKQSCGALRKRSAWEEACRLSAAMGAADDAALRQFFEQEFRLYQIRNIDGTPAGVITGYYEAQLNGSRRYGAPYLYPVHGVPDDLLYLDARTLPTDGAPVRVKVAGRNVVPVSATESASGAGYLLDLAGTRPDTRTKRYRVRVDGERVTAYFSRDDIAGGRMKAAKVIAWVDNPSALYSMQIQGSGKVRLPDGDVIRVAYGEQNGHPFMPSLQALPQLVDPGGKRQAITTRGLGPALQFQADATTEGVGSSDVDSMIASLMPGAPPATNAAAPKPTPKPASHGEASRKNEDIVGALLLAARAKPSKPAKSAPKPAPEAKPDLVAALQAGQPEVAVKPEVVVKPAVAVKPEAAVKPDLVAALQAGSAPDEQPEVKSEARPEPAAPVKRPPYKPARKAGQAAQDADAGPGGAVKVPLSSRPNTDPSYVFFRTISDNEYGPIGALGVPLTAGRSLAVDPRTTPLGAPVFVSTTEPGRKSALNRLMVAQDTGGAIHGAVRADFFWGFGRAAFAQASQMKQNGRMWLLLPKNLQLGVKPGGGVLTRGPANQTADCLVPDPELCVD